MSSSADFSNVIAEIRDKTDIVSLISEYVTLKKKGRNYWGCCPFHNEKTASFSVNPEKAMFYCFGCQSGGDAFAFVMKLENQNFIDTARQLAERINLKLPDRSSGDSLLDKQRAAVAEANRLAADFFHSCLTKTSYGKSALEYLLQRGINMEVITRFKIGYAPNAVDRLTKALTGRGVVEEQLLKSGLANKTYSGHIVDNFRNRIIIPIEDARGAVIAFGGRALGEVQPKYLNSPDTELFSKRNCLYGLNLAKDAIKREGAIIIVEGYFDAITLHVSGFDNAVAGMGTALSARQASIASKSASKVLLCYDNDNAGRLATMRAYELLKVTGVKVRVIDLGEAKDPDEFIRNYGSAKFAEHINQANHIIDYCIDTAIAGMGEETLDARVAVLEKILLFFNDYPQPLELEERFAIIANRLKLDETLVREEFTKRRKKSTKRESIQERVRLVANQNEEFYNESERQLLNIFINSQPIRGQICEKIEKYNFSTAKIKEFWLTLYNIYITNNSFDINDALERFGDNSEWAQIISGILLRESACESSDALQIAEQIVNKNYERSLQIQLIASIEQAERLEKSGSEKYTEELRKVNVLNAELQKIRKK